MVVVYLMLVLTSWIIRSSVSPPSKARWKLVGLRMPRWWAGSLRAEPAARHSPLCTSHILLLEPHGPAGSMGLWAHHAPCSTRQWGPSLAEAASPVMWGWHHYTFPAGCYGTAKVIMPLMGLHSGQHYSSNPSVPLVRTGWPWTSLSARTAVSDSYCYIKSAFTDDIVPPLLSAVALRLNSAPPITSIVQSTPRDAWAYGTRGSAAFHPWWW